MSRRSFHRLAFATLLLVACTKRDSSRGVGDRGDASVVNDATGAKSGSMDPRVVEILRAENQRRSDELLIDTDAKREGRRDVTFRRLTARALARVADAKSTEALRGMLADEDPVTVAWAAYGLGYTCKGNEDLHVKMLAARAVSLPNEASSSTPSSLGVRGGGELDPRVAIARAVGKCAASMTSERTLVAWLSAGPAWRSAATIALGDLAMNRKVLDDVTTTALLDTIEARDATLNDMAFYALSRTTPRPSDGFRDRIVRAARAALGRPGDARTFAIKTLARQGGSDGADVASELARVVTDAKGFTFAERAEAARGLGNGKNEGRGAASSALAKLAPQRAPDALAGGEFGVVLSLVNALGTEPPTSAEPLLFAIAGMSSPNAKTGTSLARHLAEVRCAAALGLARAVSDAEVLRQCDVETSEISERARLTSLLQRPLVRERRVAFRTFAKSPHLRVREMAVEAIGQHPELGDVAVATLAEALGSSDAGLVATAAEVLHAHPELGMVLAESERRAGLDPQAPPPSRSPKKELSPQIDGALGAALGKTFPEDRFETRIALIEAAASVHHARARSMAAAACVDANVVVRERARRALRALGESVAPCEGTPNPQIAAPELENLLQKPTRILFKTETTELGVVLEPELSPVTATRIASLVQTGFYDGMTVHRVVPGFVAQFGDPSGDGYGGSGTSLRCETSPVAFDPLDVGIALAGRDTGSSQLFVTLARTPHLDGEYTRVGHAEGDWWSIAQGDRIVQARLVE